MEKDAVVIIGTGSEARIAADIFAETNSLVLGLIHETENNSSREVNDISVFAGLEDEEARKMLKDVRFQYLIAVGEIPRRKEVYLAVLKLTKRPAATAIHPRAWVSPYATMGFGNIIGGGVVINANVKTGDHTYMHSGVSVEPDSEIGSYCSISSGVRIGGNVTIADDVFIGTGAIIYPGVKIGKGALIGAGSVVLREVKAGKKMYGNPAVEV